MDEELEAAKERGWSEVSVIDDAHARGDLDRAGWHAAMLDLVEPLYLSADTPELGSGHHGTPESWESTRSIVMEGVDRSGTFLDIGCANGLLMESVHRWGADVGRDLEPYGVDISPRLADLARTRCPQWADRIWSANAATWRPPLRFDLVRTGLEYVPVDARADFIGHLLGHVVAPGGRLIVGKSNEETDARALSQQVRRWGFDVAGEVRWPHPHPSLAYTVFWLDT